MISREEAETKENSGAFISKMFLGKKVDYLIYQVTYLKLYHAALSRARILSLSVFPGLSISILVRLEVVCSLYSFTLFADKHVFPH